MGKKLLIIGNGSIAIDGSGGRYIHNHNAQLLMELADRGYDPIMLAPATRYDSDANFHNTIADEEKVRTKPLHVDGLMRKAVSLLILTVSVLRSDYVYVFFPGSWPRISTFLCRLFRKKYGLYIRGEDFKVSGVDAWLVKGAHFGLVVSPWLAQRIASLLANVETMRPMSAIASADITFDCSKYRNRQEWRLLFVGNLLPTKGIWELLDAAEQLSSTGFPFHLRIVGSGILFHDIRRAIEAKNLSECVSMAGLVSDKAVLMSEYEQADIFILPTHSEGFPRVLYEAMAKAVPIITTMVGGIPGRMKNGLNCVAIPARDPKAIADAVRTLACDPNLRLDLARSGQRLLTSVLATHGSHSDLLSEAIAELDHE